MSEKLIILILVIFCGTMLAAQVTTPEKPADAVNTVIPDKPVVPEKPAVPAVAEKPAVKKAAVKPKPPQKKTAVIKKEVEAKPAEDDGTSGGRLLSIKEGSFKYKRIPEIVIEEAEKGEEDFVHIPDENLEESGKNTVDTGEKGFLGLKRETSDWVAKVGLALLLVIVFLLYRVRSRGSRSVHRSFPK